MVLKKKNLTKKLKKRETTVSNEQPEVEEVKKDTVAEEESINEALAELTKQND